MRGGRSKRGHRRAFGHIAADLLPLESMALALLLGNTGTTTHVRARRRPPIPRAEQLLLALAFLREVRTGHLLLPPKSERLFPGHAAGLPFPAPFGVPNATPQLLLLVSQVAPAEIERGFVKRVSIVPDR